MTYRRFWTVLLARPQLSAMLLLSVGCGGVVSSACNHQTSSPPPKAAKSQPRVQPQKPVIPAPELTTFAPAPTPSPVVQPKSQEPAKAKPTSSQPSTTSTKASAYQPKQVSSLPVPSKPSQASPRIPIRVAIAQQAPYLVIGASTAATVLDQQGHLVKKLVPAAAENVVVQNGQLQVGSHTAPPVVWIKPDSETGLIYVSGRWYRGTVQVVARNGQLLGVNHVDMESYLYSVVGSEMPASWPIEALKSQAIAARSYALAHVARPFNPLYDLGDTPRWQAYKGVETETNTTLSAVEQTAGLVLSHNGGVVESLYAASDQIVQDVHKGFGMSQNGANQLARRQYSFQQILAHFYSGTRLAWLQIAS